jgi:hypothetical protein
MFATARRSCHLQLFLPSDPSLEIVISYAFRDAFTPPSHLQCNNVSGKYKLVFNIQEDAGGEV